MTPASFVIRDNLGAIESAYRRWLAQPGSVDESWRAFFEGFHFGQELPGQDHGSVVRLIDAYRELGHLQAHADPLSEPPADLPQLRPAEFGLDESSPQTFDTSHFCGVGTATLADLVDALRATYCRTIGIETMHIQDRRARRWLQERLEPCRSRATLSRPARLRILRQLQSALLFEKFLQSSYVGQKRFSLEGGETLIAMLDALIENAAGDGVKEIVMGMSHRGRLNVLANVLGKPYAEIFNEFEDNYLPLSSGGDGDVKYHLGFSGDRAENGRVIHLSLTPNPSHLEAVNTVVLGRTRAKQQQFGDATRVRGLALLIHGDAAFAGQGAVAETLNLSQLAGYTTGGTLHIIVNNQIGFTTSPSDARSTVYCTDVAKMIEAPIFHVNAEDPEAAVFVVRLAFAYRQTFHRDVVIDLVCYRRHGHNESDDASFTQPIMAARIKNRPDVAELYAAQLEHMGDLSSAERQALDAELQERLRAAKESMREKAVADGPEKHTGGAAVRKAHQPEAQARDLARASGWRGAHPLRKGKSPRFQHDDTGTAIAAATLTHVALTLTSLPDGFHVHPKLAHSLETRRQEVQAGKEIDWALAEALAFGSLLQEGCSVRLSGQDSRRGTFSQRHAVLVDMRTAAEFCPLSTLASGAAGFSAIDSPLAEPSVLGFEFGYSLDAPSTLVLWEAQFGDFANGAQVIIDQFLVGSAAKWRRDSGLVLLLPHGYEGQGPEHSSARPERFLQLCADGNIQVCQPSTPAQYFHVLRRQMLRDCRKPLIVLTPKSLLRHKKVRSPVDAFTSGRFEEIVDDATHRPGDVRRVLLCSGKIYYDLLARFPAHAKTAVVRLEQFYPLDEQRLAHVLGRYGKATEIAWVQEEPSNMGAWSYLEPRLRRLGFEARYVGRPASASPAVGSHRVHVAEQEAIVEAALNGKLLDNSKARFA